MNDEIINAIKFMAQEKGIESQLLAEKIGNAIVTSCKKAYGGNEITHCEVDMEHDIFRIFIRKKCGGRSGKRIHRNFARRRKSL